MKKQLKYIFSLSIMTSLILSGCAKENVIETIYESNDNYTTIETHGIENNVNVKLGAKNVVSVGEIRNKYGTIGTEISPLYNVDPKAKFTFHFNSKVDPFQAVTVHTDRACDKNSIVFTQNLAYFMPDGGIDLIVSNELYKISVLDSEARLDYNENETTWGHASQYFLSINYDMKSDVPKKLDDPIIIPFTIKNDVQTPQVTYKINNVGEFSITWNKVPEADSYRIYSVFKDTDLQGDFLNREHGYSGLHLNLVDEISAENTEYKIKDMASFVSILSNGKQEVATQNIIDSNSDYFVTAVNDGKESNFGLEVNTYKYRNQLPYEVDKNMTFGSVVGSINILPNTAYVKMVDGSISGFPINFTLLDDTYVKSTGEVTYFYEVVGTKLTGKVNLIVGENSYENEVKSSIPVNSGIYETKLDLTTLSDSDFPVINNGKTTETDLTKIKEYNPNSRVVYNQDALNKRLDLEMARFLNDGVYNSDPNSIFVVDYNDRQNDLSEREKQLGNIFDAKNISIKDESDDKETKSITEEPIVNNSNNTSVNIGADIGDNVITGENVIVEKLKSEEEKIEQGKAETVEISREYYIKADTAEEAYLAYSLISQEPEIRIDIFPSLLDMSTLEDVYSKVYFQNPYFLGADSLQIVQKEDGSIYLLPKYNYTKEEADVKQQEIYSKAVTVLSNTITNSMSTEEKINAIWKYLEDNSSYDYAALENGELYNFEYVDKEFNDAFNTYGILCKGVGVCQSYAYTMDLLLNMADVPCISLTGYANKTLPHAWNCINIDGNWYWIDVTNNYNTSGIPYYLYNASSDFALKNNYVLDTSYELDSELNKVYNSDSSKDWYVENGLIVSSDEELTQAVILNWNTSDTISYAIRLNYTTTLTQDMVDEIGNGLVNSGVKQEDLVNKFMVVQATDYIIIIKDIEAYKNKFGQ